VTSHYGTIEVRSQGIGQGTYFVMTFASFTRKDEVPVEELRQITPPLVPYNGLAKGGHAKISRESLQGLNFIY
jgi:hypothetical protein